MPRVLVVRQSPTEKRFDLSLGHPTFSLQNDACYERLARVRIRAAYDRRFVDVVTAGKHDFQVDRIDIGRSHDDDILDAIDHVEIAFRIRVTHVPGAEPTV